MTFPFFCYLKSDGHFWFRVMGYGLSFKDTRKHALTFSERNGLKPHVSVLGWCVAALKKEAVK